MAKNQYRITGEVDWMSTSGSAILALYNPPGSGKKLTVRSFEAYNLTATNTASAGTVASGLPSIFTLARATVSDGILEPVTPFDSQAAAWPATVKVMRGGAVSSPLTIGQISVAKQMNQNSLSWLAMNQNIAETEK